MTQMGADDFFGCVVSEAADPPLTGRLGRGAYRIALALVEEGAWLAGFVEDLDFLNL